MRNYNYKVGDCLEFRESIDDFGLIFLEETVYPGVKQYNLFPVKLDTTRKGLDKFKFGKVYVTSFPDFRKPNGITEGFMVYHFLHQTDDDVINKYFICIGNLSIDEIYRNLTGGTMANNFEEFRVQLNRWDEMFGGNGRLLPVSEILH